ncbi:phosphopyruvate hydratase [Candidatus Saccharibacteria bacterium]|nr:MAG: phosphopyruvate hydratase [Candidatus Saccharibacteria bacterium]
MKITSIHARQILDSRGNPTVEADVVLGSGVMGRAAVPSGASTGTHEACELRDGDTTKYGGQSVEKAVAAVNGELTKALCDKPADDQFVLDRLMIELDGTPNKSRLGANAILSISLAAARAAALERGVPLYRHLNDIAGNPAMSLPMPMMNIVNGGKHALGGADFQEGMVIPAGANSFSDIVRMGSEIFHALQKHLADQGLSTQVGDEGGFAVAVNHNEEVLHLLAVATQKAGYIPGKDVFFALDVAASELYKDGSYHLARENTTLSSAELIERYEQLTQKYPLVSVEDGLAEDDWDNWQKLTQKLEQTQLVGDDLLVTNLERLNKAIELKAGNAILIKVNQIGTLTETIQAINRAKEAGWGVIISHRSGETEDVFISHLAVGTAAGQIKTGSLSRSDRVAKYNELLRIAEFDPTLPLAQPFVGE